MNEKSLMAELNSLLFQKQSKKWDAVLVPKVSTVDLSAQSFAHFRKCAMASRRLPKEEVSVSNSALLRKLRLMEGRYLKRAALLLFHPDPEMFVTGAYIKIDFWGSGKNRKYTIHGNLFEQVDKTLDFLFTRISYEGINRAKIYPFPVRAIGEAVLNAVIHKDYSCGNPIQVSVYENKINIWNEGQLPGNWTVHRLFNNHPSIPHNPDIANLFFNAGYIDCWGTGILKIREECSKVGLPEPEFDYDANGLMVLFKGKPVGVSEEVVGKVVSLND